MNGTKTKVGLAKLYTTKTPITAADLLKDKKIYRDTETLQFDLGLWFEEYNHNRTHQIMCCGRTPVETLEDGKRLWEEKKVVWI